MCPVTFLPALCQTWPALSFLVRTTKQNSSLLRAGILFSDLHAQAERACIEAIGKCALRVSVAAPFSMLVAPAAVCGVVLSFGHIVGRCLDPEGVYGTDLVTGEEMSEETKTICPFCRSTLTVRLGNQTHCNSCGKSFALDRNPVSTQAADRKRSASPSTGYGHPKHACEGLTDLEQETNVAETELREATRNVLGCKGTGLELAFLKQAERDARAKRDRLLQIRGELVTNSLSN
jgi:ribosomal protein L37AE/L43A